MPIRSPLTRRTDTTLKRLMRIGAWLAEERLRPRPDGLKLMRLNALYLSLKHRLRGLSAERRLRMASAPRLSATSLTLVRGGREAGCR